MSWAAPAAGVRVIDDVLGFLGIPLEKADPSPITRSGFDALVRALVTAMETATSGTRRRAVNAAMERLDRDWGRLTEAQREDAFTKASRSVAAIIASGAASGAAPIGHATHDILAATRQATARAHGLTLDEVFTARDARAASYAQASAGFFMRSKGGEIVGGAVDAAARRVVQRGIEEGWDHRDTGRELEIVMARTIGARSRAYHEMVASVALARARTYSQLQSFEDAGITTYRFQSVLDEVTSDICRFLHGQVFEVRAVLQRFERIDAGHVGEVVDQQPFARIGKRPDGSRVLFVDSNGSRSELADVVRSAAGQRDQVGEFRARASASKLQGLGCCQPPLHPHCRSTLVPGPTNMTASPLGPASGQGPTGLRVTSVGGKPRVGPPPDYLPAASDYVANWSSKGAHIGAPNSAIEAMFGIGRVPSLAQLEQTWGTPQFPFVLSSVSSWQDSLAVTGHIVNASGRTVSRGPVDRTFRIAGDVRYVTHEHQVLDKRMTPRGLGKEILANALRLYSHVGLDHVEVHAAWLGKCAWPSMGFTWADPKTHPKGAIRGLEWFLRRHGVPRSDAALQKLVAHPWSIADIEARDGKRFPRMDTSQNPPMEVMLTLGQLFLYEGGASGEYVFDLSSAQSASIKRALKRGILKK